MPYFDYLVVGAGLYGATFARVMTDAGQRCLVIDRRGHVAGNCHDSVQSGILVASHGAHHFHTNDDRIWSFVNRFAQFTDYQHKMMVDYDGRRLSFPVNLMTLHQLWGVRNPAEAAAKLEEVRHPIAHPKNFEEWVLSQVGSEIYETFYYGYTCKQWGREPRELPAGIARRIPIRLNYDDRYFSDKYQGMPIGGYTQMVQKMLEGIDVELGVDYIDHRKVLDRLATKIVYTGPLDQLFGYCYGPLTYRSLRFEHDYHDGDFQGIGTVNYTHKDVPYTRILEHKHYYRQESSTSCITWEYPKPWMLGDEPYYPVNDDHNNMVHKMYTEMVDPARMILGGRMADYRYYDMHQVIGAALAATKKELGR